MSGGVILGHDNAFNFLQTPSFSERTHCPRGLVVHRFNLSLREVDEMLLERGIEVSYETIRRWTLKFGPLIARNLRLRQVRSGDGWHLDEVVVKISGSKYWLWRAVDQNGRYR